jgi:class 3 adenylate cyclase
MEAPNQSGANFHTQRRLLLFMSVDIAGSTAYKNTRVIGEVQPWLRVFFEFYRELPARLRNLYVSQNGGTPAFSAPVVWKAIGDELVVVAQVTDHRCVPIHLRNFRDTVRAYREIVQDVDQKLDLKASAWLAGFPVYNSVILLPGKTENAALEEDYIGPSIDTGFRLGKLASPTRLVLSLELAHLLSSLPDEEVKELPFYYDTGVELKGVLGGRPYPLLWTKLHQESPLELAENDLKPPASPVKLQSLKAYTQTFIETLGAPLFVPFIQGDSLFGQSVPEYDYAYTKICQMWQKLYEEMIEPQAFATPRPQESISAFEQRMLSILDRNLDNS